MTQLEKRYAMFRGLLDRETNTTEAALEELSAAHHISSGYSRYELAAWEVVNKALEEWEEKWNSSPMYEAILDEWLS